MRLSTALLIAWLILTGPIVTALPETGSPAPSYPVIVYTAAKQFRPLAWLHGSDRFPRGATLFIKTAQQSRELVPDFAATADANVSFDAKRVVFAGKPKPRDRWQIWQIELETGKLQRVTSSGEDAIRPLYLPDNRIVYARRHGGRFLVESISLDGTDPLILSYAPGSALPSDVLLDGRILIQTGYPLGNADTPELYTVYADGSGIESYRCDHGQARFAGKQVASGDIVFTHGDTLARFTSRLAGEVEIQAPKGEYTGDVAESAGGDWVVAYRPGGGMPFSLCVWTPNQPSLHALIENAESNLVQPALVWPRSVPNRHPSGLHEWKTANLLALNSRFSREGVIEGNIASVRLYTLSEAGKTIELGTAPVEKDGSFFVQIPGDRPLKFELLDDTGKTVKRESGWMWARSGEQRICVGCHAGPENAPENAVPQILRRSTTPTNLAASHQFSQQGVR
jgi:hypothetical protein